MTNIPFPLVPPEVDLRDFTCMFVDVGRFLDSEFALRATASEFRAGVTLLCASWHQVPAASLPDDDSVLAVLSGAGEKWGSVRNMALRGFVRCSDGRFYHPFVAGLALKAWAKHVSFKSRLIRRVEMLSGIWSELRMEVFRRDKFTCRYCGARSRKLHCDHVFPLSRGGKSEIENLVTACPPCNSSKGAKTLEEWLGRSYV